MRAWLVGMLGREPEEVTILGRQTNPAVGRLTLNAAPYLVETDGHEKIIVDGDKLWATPVDETLVKDVLDLADIVADHEKRIAGIEGAANGDGR